MYLITLFLPETLLTSAGKEHPTITTHNINRHCRVRFYACVGKPLSKQLYNIALNSSSFIIALAKRPWVSKSYAVVPRLYEHFVCDNFYLLVYIRKIGQFFCDKYTCWKGGVLAFQWRIICQQEKLHVHTTRHTQCRLERLSSPALFLLIFAAQCHCWRTKLKTVNKYCSQIVHKYLLSRKYRIKNIFQIKHLLSRKN